MPAKRPNSPRRVKRTSAPTKLTSPATARQSSPAKPIHSSILNDVTWRGNVARFATSLLPSHFRGYWLNREGAVRAAKIVGGGFGVLAVIFIYYAKDLPSPGKINAKIGQTTVFYDRAELDKPGQGTKLYEAHGNQNRLIVDYNEMPDNLKHATIAIEDRNFYKHGAFSFLGIFRATAIDLLRRGYSQGGSTITQQYVKSSLLTNEKSIGRKVKELILSIEIEQFYSKDDILKLYLNEIPYGNGSNGIEAACRTYFSDRYGRAHCAKQMNLSESALLAAIPNLPSYYSPYGLHREALVERQHVILNEMVKQGYIKSTEADKAKWSRDDLVANINKTPAFFSAITAPHFVLTLQDQLEAKYGTSIVQDSGWKVITTLDLDQQQKAEKAIADNLPNIHALGGTNAAFVSADPRSGQIYSMIGSYNFSDTKFGAFNVATANRQPGSSFKPYVYATLLAKNKDNPCAAIDVFKCPTYGAGSTIYDVPTDFNGYKPQNFGNRSYGVQSMRTALDGSLNIPAVKAMYLAGVSDSLGTAHRLGITTLNKDAGEYGLSLVLGSGEVKLVDHVNAYESFANGGVHYDPTMVLKIIDPKGNVIVDNTKPTKTPKRVLDPQVAAIMSNVLSDNGARQYIFGNDLTLKNMCINNSATNCVHAAAKTGTTEKFADGWTMGFTNDIVAGVWVGNNDNASMKREAADVAAPVWRQFMNSYTGGRANEPFAKAEGVKTLTLDKNTGRLPNAATKATTTDIFPSWYHPATAPAGKTATIDKLSTKLATDCTPPLARDTISSNGMQAEVAPSDFMFSFWNPPVQNLATSLGVGGGSAIPTENDDKHQCSDAKPQVSFSGLTGGGPYAFNVNVTSGTFTANKLEVFYDDQIISTQAINGSGSYPITHKPAETGAHAFKAVVTDNGYYQGETTESVNVTNTSGTSTSSFQGLLPNSDQPPGQITFAWTASPGATSYTLYVGGAPYPAKGALSKTIPITTKGAYGWYVQANNGERTPDRTFSVN